MDLFFDTNISEEYKNSSQKIRVLSEFWVGNKIFCPQCGKSIKHYNNNKPVADFFCEKCDEDYELKSKKNKISSSSKINDGAYSTMIERLNSDTNPNFFFLSYDSTSMKVSDFCVVPKYFFTPEIIEKRKPLSENAKRSGWTGCNILLKNIPEKGKIFYIKNQIILPKDEIINNWKDVNFVKDLKDIKIKGWVFDIMKCIDLIKKQDFSLDEVYKFEELLKNKHPDNNHIKDKIRQQLQVLRDSGYLEFTSRGFYRLK